MAISWQFLLPNGFHARNALLVLFLIYRMRVYSNVYKLRVLNH